MLDNIILNKEQKKQLSEILTEALAIAKSSQELIASAKITIENANKSIEDINEVIIKLKAVLK